MGKKPIPGRSLTSNIVLQSAAPRQPGPRIPRDTTQPASGASRVADVPAGVASGLAGGGSGGGGGGGDGSGPRVGLRARTSLPPALPRADAAPRARLARLPLPLLPLLGQTRRRPALAALTRPGSAPDGPAAVRRRGRVGKRRRRGLEAAGSPGRSRARVALGRRPAPCHPLTLLSARRRATPAFLPLPGRRLSTCSSRAPGQPRPRPFLAPLDTPAGPPRPPPLLSFAVFPSPLTNSVCLSLSSHCHLC